jgi:DNA-binding HxlR family transcriptional regulator
VTARGERAARAGPGTVSDRRGTVTMASSESSSRDSPTLTSKQCLVHIPVRESTPRDPNTAIAGGRILGPPLGLAAEGTTFSQARPLSRRAELSEQEVRESSTSTFSILYELDHHRGTLEILWLLYREESASKSRMRRKLRPAQKAIESSLEGLVRMKLIDCESVRSFPFSKTYRLTERGRILVETPLSSWSLFLTI